MRTETFEGLMLPPEAILADENVRFGLLKYRVDSMAEDIGANGIRMPLEVTELAELGENGETHKLTTGHYRLAAALKLKKAGSDIQVPVVVLDPTEALERVKLQLSENMERQDMTPMDMAVAIQKLLDTGMQRVDIRKVFQRPGGRKGATMQPLSFSMIAIYLSFLEYPKAIQDKIHNGTLGVSGAYALGKYARDKGFAKDDPKIAKILETAEADRLAELEAQEKDETTFLEQERKAAEAEERNKKELEAIKTAEQLAVKTEEAAKAKVDESAAQFKAVNTIPAKDKDARKAAEDKFKELEAERKAAEKAAVEARAQAEKLKMRQEKAAADALERRNKLEAARNQAAAKAGVSKAGIDKAAQKVDSGHVKLTGPQMRGVITDLKTPVNQLPKVKRIAEAFDKCFDGETTDAQLAAELAYITGERKEKPKHLK